MVQINFSFLAVSGGEADFILVIIFITTQNLLHLLKRFSFWRITIGSHT